jgi:K+-sensing histidine kinase KdpD
MRRRTDYILMLRPWSLSTFMAALLAVAFATTMQELFAEFGARLCFSGFLPAILIASLVGGAPAGIFATLLTIPIVWWAFMPPYFEFSPFTPADREALAILRK